MGRGRDDIVTISRESGISALEETILDFFYDSRLIPPEDAIRPHRFAQRRSEDVLRSLKRSLTDDRAAKKIYKMWRGKTWNPHGSKEIPYRNLKEREKDIYRRFAREAAALSGQPLHSDDPLLYLAVIDKEGEIIFDLGQALLSGENIQAESHSRKVCQQRLDYLREKYTATSDAEERSLLREDLYSEARSLAPFYWIDQMKEAIDFLRANPHQEEYEKIEKDLWSFTKAFNSDSLYRLDDGEEIVRRKGTVSDDFANWGKKVRDEQAEMIDAIAEEVASLKP